MTKPTATLLIDPIGTLVTCQPTADDPVGRVKNASLAVSGETIIAAGPRQEVLASIDASGAQVIGAGSKVVAPGYIDSHTHLVFGGSRVQEYAAGLSHPPDEVQQMGIPTGILATVEMTRSESLEELTASAAIRLDGMLAHGTTTAESKSGYGLSTTSELKMLEVNRRLQAQHPVDIISTFLGAHAVPPELPHQSYVDLVVEGMIPEVAAKGLAQFCDVYCDEGYFTVEDSRRILEGAHAAGLKLKIHTDQYSDLGGAALAAELGVISADHLNYTNVEAARRLAESGVIGVLMPLIDFAVAHPRPFQARAMIDAGLDIALATDLCPGCWSVSMTLAMQFITRQQQLAPEEAFLAATVCGARALDLIDRGRIAPGMLADIQIWDLPSFDDAFYRLGHNPVERVIKRGRTAYPPKEIFT